MAKKKKSNKKMITLSAIIITLILFIVWLMYFGGLSMISMNIASLNSGNKYQTTTITCEEHNIASEFSAEFGPSTIFGGRTACLAVGGYWTEDSSEISCLFPSSTFNCFDPRLTAPADFCYEELFANWHCDPNIGYIGCYCERDIPLNCIEICEDHGYDNSGFAYSGELCEPGMKQFDQCCCWNDAPLPGADCENSYPYCDADCDGGDWCMEIVPNVLMMMDSWCDCVPLGGDCNAFCINDYGYDYGELAHSHFDCEPNEDYIDGCCCGDLEDTCWDAIVPTGLGDVGAFCDQQYCSSGLRCDNYYDAGDGIHRCGCTEVMFCQPCYEYFYTVNCECQPGYHKELPDVGLFQCVPDGGSC